MARRGRPTRKQAAKHLRRSMQAASIRWRCCAKSLTRRLQGVLPQSDPQSNPARPRAKSTNILRALLELMPASQYIGGEFRQALDLIRRRSKDFRPNPFDCTGSRLGGRGWH
jgi:hypothetical protein